jgi:uncharacterized protein (DUF2249 family)
MSLIQLDLRNLPAPEPMECVIAALRQLRRGRRIEALTPMRPLPLMAMLDDWGYAYCIEDMPGGQARIFIAHSEDASSLPAHDA